MSAKVKHGLSYLPIYQTHANIIDRCYNEKNKEYPRYGGKGISVCTRWLDVSLFREDLGDIPVDKPILIRCDNSKNYEPGNVFWGTKADAARTRKSNVNLTYKGKTQCLYDWAKELGLDAGSLYARVKYGWDDTRVLETPITRFKKWDDVEYIDPITKEVTRVPIVQLAKLTKQSGGAIREKLEQGLPLEVVLSNKKRKPCTTRYYDFHGEQKTVSEIATELNITCGLVHRHIREGRDLNELKPNTKEYIPFILLTYEGKTQNITQWSKELGISDITISRRISAGYPIAKVLDPTDPRKIENEYSFRGDKFTAREISSITGMDVQGVHRLIRLGVDLDTYNFDKPPEPTLVYNGVTKTHKEWAKEIGISIELIRYRIKQGFPIEEILSPETLRYKTYLYKGKQLSVNGISKVSGKSDAWVRKCIREGLDLDTVLEGSTREKSYLYEGELRTVKEIVAISGRSKAAVYRMIKGPS